MTSATIQLNIVPKKMLTQREAAHYCGRPITRFRVECPCTPTPFPNGDERYNVNDLDTWLDSLKAGASDHSIDSIIERLG